MNVILKTYIQGVGYPGLEVEVSDEYGERLIAAKLAEKASENDGGTARQEGEIPAAD
jgi:ribosomal protein L9